MRGVAGLAHCGRQSEGSTALRPASVWLTRIDDRVSGSFGMVLRILLLSLQFSNTS